MKKKDKAANENLQQEAAAQEEIPQEQQEAAVEASIDEWREALETAVKQRDEYLDSLRRSQAEFQNFRRRNETVRADAYQEGIREALKAILPVIDNLERAVEAAQDENDPVLAGVKMTLSQFMESTKKFGMAEIPALGEDFDPEIHNAVMRESTDGEPGKILEVFQKGYRVGDKVIRYSMVKVSAE